MRDDTKNGCVADYGHIRYIRYFTEIQYSAIQECPQEDAQSKVGRKIRIPSPGVKINVQCYINKRLRDFFLNISFPFR